MALKTNEIENVVFNAIKSFLNENRVLKKENLIRYIKSYFSKSSINLNERSIIENIESLIKKGRIVEGSKLISEDVLNNPKRRKIYEFIRENPCVYFNTIVTSLKLSNNLVFWHLNVLLKFNFIKKSMIENHEIYFDKSIPHGNIKKLYFQNKEISKKILNCLKNDEVGINQSRLSEKLKIHPKTIKKYLDILEEIGLIMKKKISKKEILYFLK